MADNLVSAFSIQYLPRPQVTEANNGAPARGGQANYVNRNLNWEAIWLAPVNLGFVRLGLMEKVVDVFGLAYASRHKMKFLGSMTARPPSEMKVDR